MILTRELSLLDIAPKSILIDQNTKWIYEAIDYAINKKYLDVMNKFFMDINSLNETEVDYLLWEFHVDYIDTSDIEIKKEIVKKSIISHFNKGTVGSIKEMCKIFFGDSEVLEWYEYNGRPNYFKITTESSTLVDDSQERLIGIINEYKNVRSWIDSISFIKKDKFQYYIKMISINHKENILMMR